MDFGPEIETYAGGRVGIYGGKFLPFHRGHLSYILKAQSMVDVLFVIVQYDEVHERALCEQDGIDWMPPHLRERWIAETLKPFPNIRVMSAYEHRSFENMNDPSIDEAYNDLRTRVGGKIDIVFSNTNDYDEYFNRYLPDSEHVVFYTDRPIVNISATQVRKDGPYRHWDALPRPVQNSYVKRVAICGIESVGKTHLSAMLATAFNTIAAPEYGRLYYENLNGYTDLATKADFTEIAAGHLHLLNMAVPQANKVLISDTDLIYTSFFYINEYKEKSLALEALIKADADQIDAYLYIEPYNPHELDGTRLAVTDAARAENNTFLKSLYAEYGKKLIVIDEPNRDKRYQKCYEAVNSLIS